MLNRLFSMLGTLKGAAVAAAVIALSATTASVAGQANVGQGLETAAATNAPAAVALRLSELANTVQLTVANVTSPQANNDDEETEEDEDTDEQGHCQPLVVSQRNNADKQLRDAFHEQHTKLAKMHGKDADNSAIKSADDELKDTLRTALDDIAALTLGRNGHIEFDEEDETSTSGAHPEPCTSTDSEPNQAPLTPEQQAIVDEATNKMKDIVDGVVAALGTTQTTATTTHGRSGEHGKPESAGKSGDHGKSGEHGRPSNEEDDD